MHAVRANLNRRLNVVGVTNLCLNRAGIGFPILAQEMPDKQGLVGWDDGFSGQGLGG